MPWTGLCSDLRRKGVQGEEGQGRQDFYEGRGFQVSKVDTTPSTPKGEPTIARQHVITPKSDNEKSFKSIELTRRTPTSVAVPFYEYFTTPVVGVEKDLTSTDTLLATEDDANEVLDLFDDLEEPPMAHQHVMAPTNDSEMLFEPFSLEGGDGVDDLANDADKLQCLGDILID